MPLIFQEYMRTVTESRLSSCEDWCSLLRPRLMSVEAALIDVLRRLVGGGLTSRIAIHWNKALNLR